MITLEQNYLEEIPVSTLVLSLENVDFTDEQFDRLCQANSNYRFERTGKGELVIMPPLGGISGKREADLITNLTIWNRQTRLGVVFSSSTIFRLPNGGDRSPDVAWVSLERWDTLTPEQQEVFPPLCPDFVIELRSRSDRLAPLQAKMEEYVNSGLRLGWLINPQGEEVEIYRGDRSPSIVPFPTHLSGEDILPGFTLALPIKD